MQLRLWAFIRDKLSIRPAPRSAARPPARPLDGASQWEMLAGVIETEATRTDGVRRMQDSAGRQLEAAGYALGQMMLELSGVMQLPAQRPAAAVVRLERPVKADPAFRRKKQIAA